MKIRYDKWRKLEVHVDDSSSSSLTKAVVVSYKLVRLMDGKEIRSDKVGKQGTMVKGIVKREGGKPALFVIKDGYVSEEEFTGDYEMIGIGLIMKRRTDTLVRNMEREESHMVNLKNYSTTIRDDAHHCINNCPVVGAGQLLDPSTGLPVPNYDIFSSCVYDGGNRKQINVDYAEVPGAGMIVPITFVIGPSTFADVTRGVIATTPTEPGYEKIPI